MLTRQVTIAANDRFWLEIRGQIVRAKVLAVYRQDGVGLLRVRVGSLLFGTTAVYKADEFLALMVKP